MDSIKITCPYCWQTIEIEEIARSEEIVEFVADCEICCRPIKVTATWSETDEDPIIEAEPEA